MASQGSQTLRLKATDLLTTRDSVVSNKDARPVNVIYEQSGEEIEVLKRPGFALYDGTNSGTGMGLAPIVKPDNSPAVLSITSDVLNLSAETSTSVVLLHFDGANSATKTYDAYGNPATMATGAVLSTTSPKFGSSCLSIPNAATNVVTVTGPTSLGTAWTMECWAQWPDLTTNGSHFIMCAENGTPTFVGMDLEFNIAGGGTKKLAVSMSSNGSSYDIANGTLSAALTMSINTYYHFAVCRDHATGHYYVYFNGTKVIDITSAAEVCPITALRIGNRGDVSFGLMGKLDEFRLSSSCIYPGGTTFTPPTVAFTKAATPSVTVQVSGGSNPSLVSGNVGNPTPGWTPSNLYDFSQTIDLTKIAIKNTSAAWQLTVDGSTLVAITDANYPTVTVRGLVYLNGWFYVMDPQGRIWGSSVANDFTTWSSLNFVTAQGEPDAGVCLAKLNQYVIAFGQYTTEFFFDAGNATGSPLAPVQTAQLLMGCAAADTVCTAESALYFVAQTKSFGQAYTAGFSVQKLAGIQASTVSTPDIERLLNADGLAGSWSINVNFYGHTFYVINLPTTGISLGLDVQSGRWYLFTMRTLGSAQSIGAGNVTYTAQTDGNALVSVTLNGHGFSDGDPVIVAGATQTPYNGTWNVTYVDANTFQYVAASVPAATPATGSVTAQGSSESNLPMLMPCQYGSLQVFQHATTGKIYQISQTTFQDAGVFIDSRIRTSRQDNKNNLPKFCAWMDVITDRVSANMLVRYTDNDYASYSKYRAVSLANTRSRLTRQGSFHRRAFELRHTDNTAMRFQGLDLGVEQGAE